MPVLVDIPSNPVPRQTLCDTFTTGDGLQLRFALFAANRSPLRGTVVLLQGRNEFIEKYFETAADLRRRGFAVATYDHRGQGGSQRLLRHPRKGHVRDFADYVNDLETFIQDIVLPDCPPPYFILAHSMGGAIALLSAERLATQIDRMVITAPLAALRGASPRTLARCAGLLMHFGLAEAFVPGGGATLVQTRPFEGNPVTSDRERYERARQVVEADASVGLGAPTLGWMHAAMLAACRMAAPDFPLLVPMPVLIVLAGAETVVSNRAAEALARRLRTAAYLRIPGARHEILMERDVFRDQFWAAFDAFVQGRPAAAAARHSASR